LYPLHACKVLITVALVRILPGSTDRSQLLQIHQGQENRMQAS